MTKVFLYEEVKPHPKPAEERLYNSPPSFGGRYLLTNSFSKPIASSEFSVLKENNWISYWSSEYLEDVDMFYEEPGWRLTAEGIEYLKKRGYEVEVNTIEKQNERAEIEKEAEIERQRLKAIEKEENDRKYKEELAKYEEIFTNNRITFHERWTVDQFKDNDYISDGSFRLYSEKESFLEFGLTPDNRIYKFQQYTFDWWTAFCSDQPAPQEFVKTIQDIRDQKQRDFEEREKKRIEELKSTLLYETICQNQKCGRAVYVNEKLRNNLLKGHSAPFCKAHRPRTVKHLNGTNAVLKLTGNTMTWFDALEQKKELNIER